MRAFSSVFPCWNVYTGAMQVRKSAHAVYKTQYHLVWITRYRRKILVPGVGQYLRVKFQAVHKYYPDWEYIAIGVDTDHVHLHMIIPPKYAVSKVVETLKKNTSRQLRNKFPFLQKVYWDGQGIWGRGYFVSTVGIDEAIIQRYVAFQGREDTGQATLDL